MRPKSFPAVFILSAVCAAGALFVPSGRAQTGGPYALSWSTIDGGGGTSSGGRFAVSGTIGQSDAGALAGGSFKLEGGFWSGVTALQTPGAPVLKIKLVGGGKAILSWPVDLTGFVLEETATASQPSSWTATLESVADSGSEHTVTVPAAGVIKCYRLKKP